MNTRCTFIPGAIPHAQKTHSNDKYCSHITLHVYIRVITPLYITVCFVLLSVIILSFLNLYSNKSNHYIAYLLVMLQILLQEQWEVYPQHKTTHEELLPWRRVRESSLANFIDPNLPRDQCVLRLDVLRPQEV